MSMITGLIQKLRKHADDFENSGYAVDGIVKDYREAADTIEMLSEKARSSDWILCSKKMPEEREWIGTKRFGTTKSDEVYVTLENSKGERYTQQLSFQNGKLSPSDQHRADTWFKGGIPIAWMPQPEPYMGGSEE